MIGDKHTLILSKRRNYPKTKQKQPGLYEEAKTIFWWETNYTKEQHHLEYYLNVFQQIKERKSWMKST